MATATPKFRYDYRIDPGCRKSKEQKEAVLSWVTSDSRFSQKGRKPTTEEFIREATRKGSEMYKARVLEVDVSKAAAKHWRNEAQYYLRHINVVCINIETKVTTPAVRAFIPVRRSRFGRIAPEDYKTAKRVANDPSLKQTVLEQAKAELQAWVQRYENYGEFFEILDMALSELRKLAKKRKEEEN